MTFGEVCAGVGGLSLGLEQAGLRPSWFVEIDRAAAGVLAIHHPTVPIYRDLTRCYLSRSDAVDLIAGGTPCQDLSVAGKRAGFKAVGETKGGLLAFQMLPSDMPPAESALGSQGNFGQLLKA